jgi:TRAP-type C4-dicarboxylate transport system permease small subunit
LSQRSGPGGPAERIGRALRRLSEVFALFGGLVLVAVMLMEVTSITQRGVLGRPIPGDFELVQIGCAVAVFAFLPWCELRGGNIIVDAFTTRLGAGKRALLDALSHTLLGLLAGLIAWRMIYGAQDLYDYNDTTMVLGFPSWIGYVPATLSAFLLSLAAFWRAWESLRTLRR